MYGGDREITHSQDVAAGIEVRGLTKSFGRAGVLRKLDLDVKPGEPLTVLGPNGSGKTTLINIVATLTKADAGSVRVGGLDIDRRGAAARSAIGVVTHEPMLYEQLTALENLRFHARMFALNDSARRVAHVAETMGIGARMDERVGTLSHGMQKRVSIARALLHEPRVLVMDEPESGLDQEAIGMLEGVIADASDAGHTVLLTTHNVERALAWGRRLAILAGGRVAHDEVVGTSTSTASVREAYARFTGAAE